MMRSNVVVLLFLAACAHGPQGSDRHELILCGGDEVYILDVTGPGEPRKVWSWRAADRSGLQEPLRKRFASTDECKPVDEGSKILITSSGGGVALVERVTGRALFWASVVNAHSAEVLPNNRVVVASSYGDGGNRLVLFDLGTPDKPVASDDLYGAHAAVWDEERQTLWALGEKELRAYRLKDWDTSVPSLSRTEEFALPDPGGHDLRPLPHSGVLLVTTGKQVWHFGRDRKTFVECPHLPASRDVKSVDVNPLNGRWAYVQAETKWWAERIRLLYPEGTLARPGERLYKARWNIRPEIGVR